MLSLDDVETQFTAVAYSNYTVEIEPGSVKAWRNGGNADVGGSVLVRFGPQVIRRCSFKTTVYEDTDMKAVLRGILASLSTHVLRDLKANATSFIVLGRNMFELYDDVGADSGEAIDFTAIAAKKITRAIEF